MADFGGADLEAFRAEARDWIAANFPASLKGRPAPEGRELSPDQDAWRKAMGEKGWGVPTWPSQYGGGGLSRAEAAVIAEELARAGAYNPIGGMGVIMFGPTLLEYGDEAQKQKHIPPIVRGEVRWCQGFSEPGAGSDLAGLQTKAEDKGDHFLINGSKIWTSGAHLADMCFCLVRTDPTKKHEGISFVMIDMHQPGVEARPIRLINDTTPFCETFFTDAKAPKENLVGPLNGGWTVAKRLLQHERQGISGAGGGAPPGSLEGPTITELAKTYVGLDETGRLADPDLRRRLTDHLMEERAFQLTGRRAAVENRGNSGPSAASSVLKNVGSNVRTEKSELAVEILGCQGLGWGGEAFARHEVAAIKTMLRSKAGKIAGGSWEVQLNIISKRILGLPETTQKG
ncbi:MAG: acyl-CoA dehydrogenase [Phenylobacterium sp.]|uniref:acyl-CoA dehydrogenase family protein n=1 Tax=Phenylobacterium sp. TaxID=1871053 RepID=UPI0025DFDE88|nr:acyl-CoA dehydrogenase family protein [Phenylobacterium sp.]MBI1199164.1 acyl-CoA dehydrogenase [Phenylobacterium sp.]